MNILKSVLASLLLATVQCQASCDSHEHQHHHHQAQTTANHVFAFNNFDAPTTITAGDTISFNNFNTLPVEHGAVFQSSADTFTIRQSGHYYLNVVVDALTPLNGTGLILLLDGVAYQSAITPTGFNGSPLVLQAIIPIIASWSKPVDVQVFVQNQDLDVPAGVAATISIFQLSKTGNL